MNQEIYSILVNKYINLGATNCTTKSVCKKCVVYCFEVLIKYNLHSMAYSHLFLAYKFILTLSCTQVCCESIFLKLKYNQLKIACLKKKNKTIFINENLKIYFGQYKK